MTINILNSNVNNLNIYLNILFFILSKNSKFKVIFLLSQMDFQIKYGSYYLNLKLFQLFT